MKNRFLDRLVRSFSENVHGLLDRFRPPEKEERDIAALAEALLSGRKEASDVAAARAFLDSYERLTETDRLSFLVVLDREFGLDQARLQKALRNLRDQPTARTAREMHEAAEPRRVELFRRINLAKGGTKGLLRMREDVLRNLPAHLELSAVDEDFKLLFASWFNRGFLVLSRLDWTTPANILEKIIRYEAVHEIAGWDDLRRRLEPTDRRCFAFFHPTMEDEPLIFVAVALAPGVPDAIGPLLANDRDPLPAAEATTAVFYSISSCQAGLKGVPLGDFLIKQVVEELRQELPSLKTFVTLSPVGGFLRWLAQERAKEVSDYLAEEDRSALALLDRPDWHLDPDADGMLKPRLLPAVAAYLLAARNDAGKPLDPVARFHLGNGARLERICWKGDLSPKGLGQAAGFMVNYLYELDRMERNREAFVRHGEIAASHAVRRHLRAEVRKRSGSPT
ncbi:MAG TPA: malonyl-CoA decarboxylase [Candidatus Aquicultoraceae bacterium]|jgi:malonyl-CoA decarboxylase|nr:malonyl-CoA decarboxylase [Candidatus Aquicultoraceae bacterium]